MKQCEDWIAVCVIYEWLHSLRGELAEGFLIHKLSDHLHLHSLSFSSLTIINNLIAFNLYTVHRC